MKYLKRFHNETEWEEVSKEKAEFSVFTTYYDNDETRSWLEKEGEIYCRYAVIKVISELD